MKERKTQGAAMPSVVCPVLAYIMEIMTLAFCQNMCTAVPALARETSI